MGFEPLGLCTAVGFQALTNATTAFGNSGFGETGRGVGDAVGESPADERSA